MGDNDLFAYIPRYLQNATDRMNQYAPGGFAFTVNDTYAMQSICAYETAYIGLSDFCPLFTLEEWAGFEQTLDMEYFYDVCRSLAPLFRMQRIYSVAGVSC